MVFVKGGLIIILGCGGLDYIVVLIVVGFDVSVIEIWMDVDGVFIVDFCKVKWAFIIFSMIYVEVMEMFYFGVKVIYLLIL